MKRALLYLPLTIGWGVAVWLKSGPIGIGIGLAGAVALVVIAEKKARARNSRS